MNSLTGQQINSLIKNCIDEKALNSIIVNFNMNAKTKPREINKMLLLNDKFKKLFGEVFTPIPLVEEMLDKLPKEVWSDKNLKWLDPACGTCNFHLVIKERLMEGLKLSIPNKDEREKWILENMIYGVDIQERNVILSKLRLDPDNKYKLNIDAHDSLAFDFWGLKFDIVVGNPPYGKSSDDSDFTNLWADFVHKSFLVAKRYVVMVTPKTWINQVTKENNSSKVFDLIKKYAQHVNIDNCSKYFNGVGSSFSYYILDKKNNSKKCKVVTNQGESIIQWQEIPFITNRFDTLTLNIIKKILEREMFDFISSSGTVGDISNVKTDKHIYSVRYSMGTEKWSNIPHKYQFVKKLIFPNQTSKNFPIYAPESAPANRGVFYVVKNEIEAENMLHYIKSKQINFLISQQRTHHGVLNTQVIQHLPKIDLSHKWSDQELYSFFKLSPEEIKLIEGEIS